MDYIKSWFEYFRGNTTNRSKEKQAEDLKNEILKYGNDSSFSDNHESRRMMDIDFPDIMNIFFNDSNGQPEHPDIMSDMNNHWPFGGGIFRSSNEMHREFLNLVNDLYNGFSHFPSFTLDDIGEQNLGNCRDCDRPLPGESLRDSYLRVPPLISTDDNGNEVNVIIPGNDGNRTSSIDSVPNSSKPHFHQTQIVVSVGPNGDLEMTKIITDSYGNAEKTVTKLNLKDKM